MNILNEIFEIFEENDNNTITSELWKECRAGLDIIPEKSIEDVTNLIHSYARECEKYAFNNGFYYGVQLMMECMTKGNSSNN